MTIHRPTQLSALTADPNSLVAFRMAGTLQRRRASQGGRICTGLPSNLATSQSAPDLRALIQSALDIATADDINIMEHHPESEENLESGDV
mmetsp:Transcript_7229/g.13796  ORF Transcript_7229/g.13796 Transcript_7229/m.13796 type:complete len:91 (+) Transcript_7229:227-499(+)